MDDLYITKIKIKSDIPETEYIYHLPIIKNIRSMGGIEFKKAVTFFVGENGIGKSTLIEAVAVAAGFNAEGGSINMSFSTKQTHSNLFQHITLVRSFLRPKDGFFLRAESFYNVASDVDQLEAEMPGLLHDYGGISLHQQSHGESFLALTENRFRGKGLYILDEPEAALSPKGIMRLMVNMKRLSENGSQFLISTHSPMLMAFPNAEIFEITKEDIQLKDYRQTEHYLLTKRFLESPEKMLHYLLEEN